MTKEILVIAPHPDDETIGCGGTLLRHKTEGHNIHWVICTEMKVENGFAPSRIAERHAEIEKVSAAYSFDSTWNLGFATTLLDSEGISTIISKLNPIFSQIQPTVVYLPYRGDAHTDHRIVFDAGAACCKAFRCPSVKKVLCYETLSETDYCINPDAAGFRPQLFTNIETHLSKKLEILSLYRGELGEFPFPRSETALTSLARVRGAASNLVAAEGFMILREIET